MANKATPSPAPPPSLATARRPAQKRSLRRVEALLDAADALLQERDINDVGLYEVANAAKVPPTSAYHFFPTKESIFLALAERYLVKMHASLDAPMDLNSIERWQDLVAAQYNRVVEYFNANLPARKLFMGMALQSDIKKLDFQDIDNSAAGYYRFLGRYFEMPYVRDPTFKFSVTFAIHDGIWATSYAKFGYITPEFAREGLRAALAYMSTFLPETIPLRAPSDETHLTVAERQVTTKRVAAPARKAAHSTAPTGRRRIAR